MFDAYCQVASFFECLAALSAFEQTHIELGNQFVVFSNIFRQ